MINWLAMPFAILVFITLFIILYDYIKEFYFNLKEKRVIKAINKAECRHGNRLKCVKN